MKSQQKEGNNSIYMSCKGCVFAEYSEPYADVQLGCVAGRIDQFKKQDAVQIEKEDGEQVFMINRLCNLFRDNDWLDKIATESESNSGIVEQAIEEIKPKFAIVIYDRNVEGRDLKKTLDSIIDADYDHDKMFVVINYIPHPGRDNIPVERLIHSTNCINSEGIKTSLVLNRVDEQSTVDYNAFNKCTSATHLVKMDSFSTMPKNMLRDIHKTLNIDMQKIILFRHKSISCVSFPVVNSQYLDHNDFDKMLSSIESAAKQVNMTKDL